MNKGDLIEAVATELNETKANATRAVEAVLGRVADGVKRDGKVVIVGFGSFEKKSRAARKGINPSTKQPIEIKASVTVGFKPSQALKDEIANGVAR